MEKLLPQNIEAECGVLGSIIIDPDAIVQVADFLYAEDFYRDAHRTIYEVIMQLYEQREPADFITICDELERRNRLEEVGGPAYITSLINQVPTSGNVEYYGRIVERSAVLRRLIHAAGQIAAVAYEEVDASIALDKAEQLIFAIGQRHARADFAALRDLLSDYMEKLDQLHERRGSIVGVPTGFTDLDRLTGGLQKSDLIILAARPAMGKCLAAWTLIDDPETGERLTIEESVKRKMSQIYGISEEGKVRVANISDWVDSDVKPCYRVQTRLGRMVEVTGHHPFLTVHGWKPLHDLKVGQYIAVPTTVPAFGTDESWPIEKVRLLAYFIAEGKQENFPSYVWRWSRHYLAEFLHVLIGCGSSAYPSNTSAVEFATAAQQLAIDVQHALTRFGIISNTWREGQNTWRVAITGDESVQKYQREISWIEKRSFVPVGAGVAERWGGDPWVAQTLQGYEVPLIIHDIHDGARWATQGSPPHSSTTPAPTGMKDASLRFIASPDIYWDEIVSIEHIGEHQVYDLTVPDGANFVAQDIFVHNTSLALSLAHNSAIKHKQSIAIFSLEMSKEQLVQRILSMDAGVDQQRLRTGWIEDEEWERIIYSMGTLAEANIWIEDTAGISTTEMRSKARRLHAEHGIDLIIVDYLQLMQSNMNGVRNKNREQEISEISRNLKGLARELNIPVLALAQLSRAVESRQSKVPQLSDLRESGSIEQDSDIVMFIYRDDVYNPESERKNIADIIIAKHRNGPVGEVSLYFQASQTRFRDLEATPPAE